MEHKGRKADLQGLQASRHCDGWDDISGHASTVDGVVSRDVVGNEPEDRPECVGVATTAGAGQLSNGLADVAQTSKRHGQTGTGSAEGASGG